MNLIFKIEEVQGNKNKIVAPYHKWQLFEQEFLKHRRCADIGIIFF
jgi:hypothetical protein